MFTRSNKYLWNSITNQGIQGNSWSSIAYAFQKYQKYKPMSKKVFERMMLDLMFCEEDFENDMMIFRFELEEWKKLFEEKKKEIKKMPREKISEDREYQGEKKNGIIEGFGILFTVGGKFKGERYEGEFRNDAKSEKGICWADGNRLEAEWKNDKPYGQGICYWIDGNWREGELKNGKWHGKAIKHFADG